MQTAATGTTSGSASTTTRAAGAGSGGNRSAFCTVAKAIERNSALLGNPTTGPAFVKSKAAYAALAADAPSVVKADIVYLSDYLTAMSAAGNDSTKQTASAKTFSTEATTTHLDNLHRFMPQSCGVAAAG